MTLQYLSYNQIDKTKWDNCIANADNSLIYGYSFYLDALAEKWDAIIVNDYEAVLPLPWRKKWGIKYYYKPPFIQQLGLFTKGNATITPEMIALFCSKVKYGDIFFNHKNDVLLTTQKFTNYILSLNQPHQDIEKNYKKDLKNNLKKAEKENLTYCAKDEITLAITLYQKHYLNRTPHIKKINYQKFLNLCKQLSSKKMAFTRSVVNEKQEILSIGVFLFDNKRIYNILNTTTEEGKAKESNPYLLNQVIKEFSGSDIIFDFEGSDIEGIKFFYEKFNAVNEPYFFYHYNNLPKLLQLIKK